jgi:hypothetical protein
MDFKQKPAKQPFEKVDWNKYKESVITRTRLISVPFKGPRLSVYLETGLGGLDIAKADDRRYIRETQRILRPQLADQLRGFFELCVLEIASHMKAVKVTPGPGQFELTVRKYALAIITDLQNAESPIRKFTSNESFEQKAISDAMAGKSAGGKKN